jgi:CRP-like cAMP-binding protein
MVAASLSKVFELGSRVEILYGKTDVNPCATCPLRSQAGGGCIWPNEADASAERVEQTRMKRNDILLQNGKGHRNFWLLKSGFLRVVQYGRDGRRHVITVLRPGEVAGFAMPTSDAVTVEAASHVVLCQLDRKQFARRVSTDGDFRKKVYRQQLQQLDRMHWLIWSIGALTPEERLAAFFAQATVYMPSQRMPDGSIVLTQELPRSDVADLLSTSAETVSRFTHRLEGMGWIKIIDPAHFRILDLKAIARLGKLPEDAINTLDWEDEAVPARLAAGS